MFFKKKPEPQRTRRPLASDTAQRERVFSYRASRSAAPEGSARGAEPAAVLRRQKQSHWKKRLYTFSVLAIFLLGVFMSLRLNGTAQIVLVDDGTGQIFLRDTAIYQEEAEKLFGAFFNGNKLTADADAIATELRKKFPELRTVSISLPMFGNKPVVYIQPVTPKLIVSTVSDGLYIVDSSGVALLGAGQVAQLSSLNIPVIVDESGVPAAAGKAILPRSTVAFISEVTGQLKAKQLTLEKVTLLKGGNELQVQVSGAPYFVKFNTHGEAREQAGSFLAVKQKLEGDKKIPREYIDARVDGKVFYK